MGNSSVKDAVEEAKGNRSLDLSCKLTPEQYDKHTSGAFIEGCLLALPWEIYYNTVSMYESVNASFNFISEIPEELSLHVPHLQSLNLSHNQITTLPHSFRLLLHLRVLDLSNNRLKSVPEPLTGLPKLHTLNLADNNLTELPTTMERLRHLEKLNVSNNSLRALPGNLGECPKLCILVTHGNELIHPPQAICDMGSESTLHFLRERHSPALLPRPSSKVSVFTRVRGTQVVASVSNPESASMEYRQAQGMSRSNKLKCPLMPPASATSLKPDQLTDMLLGLVYGSAIGDAMALNTEGLSTDECKFFYESENFSLENRICDRLRTHFPPNDWSSNTDIMLLTLDSLMRWGGVVDELELACQLDQWRVHGFSELDPMPGYFLSPYMKRVIMAEGYSANPHAVSSTVHKLAKDEITRGIYISNPCDNSCLPPALVLGIPCFYMHNEVEMNAERICRASHSDPVAQTACVFVALFVASILEGKVKEGHSAMTDVITELMDKVMEKLSDKRAKEKFCAAFHTQGQKEFQGCDVLTSVRLLMLAVNVDMYDFKQQVINVVMQGGEGVCVHAGVVGGVLGALLGYSHLPQDWLTQLPQENIKFMNNKLNLLLDLFGLP